MLQSLHYDLAVMLCTFMDQQSRLAFALTCRWLKGVIIPECLVRSLRLQTARKAAHFCRLILVPNSRVGENVQLLNIDFHRTASASVTQLIANALIRMPNLRHLDLPFPFYGSDHRILREISNLPRLHHLFLGIRDETCIEQLENLRAMESLHFTPTQNLILHPDGVIMNMNLRSTLGDLFLRSRESLSKLTLCMPILERPIPKKAPHDSRDDALEDIWPAVRFLNLRSFPQDRFDHMDLSRMFPAALHFIAPLYHWSSSRASQFMLRLISLEADWVDLQVAVEAGAPLRRAVAATNWVLSIGLWFLPSTLEYLSLAMEGKDLSDFIASAHHATVPNLKALAITIHLRKKRRHDHARLTSDITSLSWCPRLEYALLVFDTRARVQPSVRRECASRLFEECVQAQYASVRIGDNAMMWHRPNLEAPTRAISLAPTHQDDVIAYYTLPRWME